MALIGAAIAFTVLLCRKGMGARLQQIAFFLYGLRYGVKIPLFVDKSSLSAAYPYGVAIAGGVALCLGYEGWGSV
jgi:prepilin peptidase CpaA